MRITKSMLLGTAATAMFAGFTGSAFAQSTGTQVFEEPLRQDAISVTGSAIETDVLSLEEAAKARASITEAYINTQQPGQTIFETLNILPGVSFTNTDAYGSSGGNLNIRGFDGNRVSATFDGIPLNDTGNYALYTNQMLDPELISRATVNTGATDVDSPTASATGGSVNYVTKRPEDEASISTVFSIGDDDDYRRYFIRFDTGEVGPLGTTAYFSYSKQDYNYFIEGQSEVHKEQFNGQVYQPLGENGDFVRVMAHWNQNRNHFRYPYTISLEQFNAGENNTIDQYTLNHRINPSNTGNIRGQAKFTLTDKLVLTVDPSVQYVLANGGVFFPDNVNESTEQQFGGMPVDINGDGDFDDTLPLYNPSNTNTIRYGVISSLIYKINDDHRVRAAYTFDQGRHRQTGDYSFLNTDGSPVDPFGGKDGHGPAVKFPDGSTFQKRDRLSIASLNQLSVEYVGEFMNDDLTVNAGLRLPYFERDLDQRCYARKGSSSSTQYCTLETPTVLPSGYVMFPSSATQEYAPPFKADVTYDDVLPNVGVSYFVSDAHQVFASYAETISAPRTDDLYGGILVSELDDVQPETSQAYDVGYRYRGDRIEASATIWMNKFQNRIERQYDPALDVSLSRNVGEVDLSGFEGTFGMEVMEGLSFFTSAAFTDSEIAASGNELGDTPEMTLAARIDYETGPYQVGLQGRHMGDRWTDESNTVTAPSYTVFNFDASYDLGDLIPNIDNARLRLNIQNLFDEEYLGQIDNTNSFYRGAPRTTTFSIEADF